MTAPVIAASGVSHIARAVSDVGKARRWHEAVFGYELLWDGPAPTPDRTRSALGLICGGNLALELLETPHGRTHSIDTLGIAGLSITVPDVAAAVAAYEGAGFGKDHPVIEAQDW